MAKINDDSLEKMWEAFNLLVSEQNDEQNGMTKSERKRLDTITSKLTLLLESLENKRLWFNFTTFFILIFYREGMSHLLTVCWVPFPLIQLSTVLWI